MNTLEVKAEINMLIEQLPEKALEDLLLTLKHELKHSEINPIRMRNFYKILAEDRNLFERLAK